jgi:hypothetical protein
MKEQSKSSFLFDLIEEFEIFDKVSFWFLLVLSITLFFVVLNIKSHKKV